MKKILLDTDIGGDIDDAITLAYLLREPECQLLGITTVCGESEIRASIADAICQAAGKNIPIVAGMDTTLQPVPVYPTPAGQVALKEWPHNIYCQGDAVTFLYETIKQHPQEVYLLGIGNMTNIATLFQKHPDVPALLAGFYVMNGYFGEEALPEPTWNWNSWADPLASQMSFQATVKDFKAFPLEVTQRLTLEASVAKKLLPENDKLMQAVYAFGNAWLESSHQLTLHDPLVAVSLFYPKLCNYRQGTVSVDTCHEKTMGATAFTENKAGNVAVATQVKPNLFYQILASTLAGTPLPKNVVNRALADEESSQWLQQLPATIENLSEKWQFSLHEPLAGGSASYVAEGSYQGKPAVLKINMPSTSGNGPILQSVKLLERAKGQGYPLLYEYDVAKNALLMEKLGRPLSALDYPVTKQIGLLCQALKKTWEIPVKPNEFARDDDQQWFTNFIKTNYQSFPKARSQAMYELALSYLANRKKAVAADFVLLHGDAHSANLLQDPNNQDSFKLIDGDGLYGERAYDLGVLMREWLADYYPDPLVKTKKRCALLHQLTGVDEQAIWEWGYLQLLGTAFVLLEMNQVDQAQEMLGVATTWI